MCWHQQLSFVSCEDGSAYFEKSLLEHAKEGKAECFDAFVY
ncbi:hypothetical protein [Amedibacillus dolichus]|nr:hypothetical protein [Amedibacillus dolichus]